MFDNDLFNENVLGRKKKDFSRLAIRAFKCACVCASVCVLDRYIHSFRLKQYFSHFAK